MIKSLDESVNLSNKDLIRTVETLANNISNLASLVLELKNNPQLLLAQQTPVLGVPESRLKMSMMNVHDFKEEFDVALATLGSSDRMESELARIRNKMCDSCNISSDEFYRLVSELTSKHQDRYRAFHRWRRRRDGQRDITWICEVYLTVVSLKLDRNPYPSSPTPTLTDAMILGGRGTKRPRLPMVSCISDLRAKIGMGTPTDKDFRLVTMIQDVGSGKTHLALHTKGLKEVSESSDCLVYDLSQISPRTMHSLYGAMLAGFTDEDVAILRKTVVDYLLQRAEQNVPNAKRIFNYGFIDVIRGKSLADKATQLLGNEIVPNYTPN